MTARRYCAYAGSMPQAVAKSNLSTSILLEARGKCCWRANQLPGYELLDKRYPSRPSTGGSDLARFFQTQESRDVNQLWKIGCGAGYSVGSACKKVRTGCIVSEKRGSLTKGEDLRRGPGGRIPGSSIARFMRESQVPAHIRQLAKPLTDLKAIDDHDVPLLTGG